MAQDVCLNDIQRQLELTLIAFWGRNLRILPLEEMACVPKVDMDTIYLPRDYESVAAPHQSIYLCAAMHAAAHIMFSQPQESVSLNNRQLVLISLFEDARVEYLCAKAFPGLKSLFAEQFYHPPKDSLQFNEIAYSIAYALAKDTLPENALVAKYVEQFHKALTENANDMTRFKALGLALANDIGQMRISMNERETFYIVDYRDDNAFLWLDTEAVGMANNESGDSDNPVSVTGVAYQETVDGIVVDGFSAEAEGLSDRQNLVFAESHEPSETSLLSRNQYSEVYRYAEWDYKIGRWKQEWCAVHERLLTKKRFKDVESRLDIYQGLVKRLQQLIQSYQAQMQRRKKQFDGVELDFDALIQAMIQIKSGKANAESRIYIDHIKQRQEELSVLVLIDLSVSMNDKCEGGQNTLLDLTLDSILVLSELMEHLGYPMAIHGFNSNGREDVSYFDLKDFNHSTAEAYAALGSIEAEYSTRLGAALRHAHHKLALRQEHHQIILVITDGEPSDIDVFDKHYLIEDAAIAVGSVRTQGAQVFCLSLDQQSDRYVEKIFGKGRYEIVDHPEKMTRIMTRLCIKMFKSFLI